MIPPVVASERGRAQNPPCYGRTGVVGLRHRMNDGERNALERATIDGDSPVREAIGSVAVS